MRKLIALAVVVLLAGCHHREKFGAPSVDVRLGMSSQQCAVKGEAPFSVFVTVIGMGEKNVKLTVNDGQEANLYGSTVSIDGKAAPGEHWVDVTVEGWHTIHRSWSVYECEPK